MIAVTTTTIAWIIGIVVSGLSVILTAIVWSARG